MQGRSRTADLTQRAKALQALLVVFLRLVIVALKLRDHTLLIDGPRNQQAIHPIVCFDRPAT